MRERSLITLPVEQCAFFLHDSRERTIQIRHHHRDRGGVLFGAHTVRCLSRQFIERERDRGRPFCHSCGTEKSRKRPFTSCMRLGTLPGSRNSSLWVVELPPTKKSRNIVGSSHENSLPLVHARVYNFIRISVHLEKSVPSLSLPLPLSTRLFIGTMPEFGARTYRSR